MASVIDFRMDLALARTITITYKQRKAMAKRRRESYQTLEELCEEAGIQYEAVRRFSVEQGMLLKLGRPLGKSVKGGRI